MEGFQLGDESIPAGYCQRRIPEFHRLRTGEFPPELPQTLAATLDKSSVHRVDGRAEVLLVNKFLAVTPPSQRFLSLETLTALLLWEDFDTVSGKT